MHREVPGFVAAKVLDPSTLHCFRRDISLARYNNACHKCVCSTNPIALHIEHSVVSTPHTIAVLHNRSNHFSTTAKCQHTNRHNWFDLHAYHYLPDPYPYFSKRQMVKCRICNEDFLP